MGTGVLKRVFLLIIFFTLTLSACALQDPLARLPKLPDGTLLENYVRKNPNVVLTYFPNDEKQEKLFSKQITAITQGKSKDAANFIFGAFLKDSGVENFIPIYLDGTFPKSLFTSWNDETGETQFLLVSVLENADTVKNIISAEQDGYATLLHENILLIASKKEFLSPSTDHSFFQNSDYQKFLRKSPRNFVGYVYINPPKEPSMSFMAYGAEDDGISISSFQKKQNHADVNLAKKIPAKNMMFGAEGTNLAFLVELEKEILKNTPFFKSLYGENPFQGLEEKIGLSYETGIKPFLQKNFAWAMEDQGKILPAISLWVDASDNPQNAEKVSKKVDETLSTFITVMNVALSATPPASAEGTETFKSPFERKTIDFNGSPLNQIVFIPQNFQQGKTPVPLFENLDETWAFTYGLTKDNLFVLSTRSEFPTNTPGQAKAKMWTDQDLYKSLRSKIRGYSKTDHVYFETKPFLDWLSRIMELGQDSSALSAKEKRGFEILQKYLAPIQGGIAGTKIKGDMAETKMLIKIR